MRIPQIQGLRALAAILVVVYHAKWLPGGYIGVDIFYVISGYLITGLLLTELESTESLALKKFYLKRIKRLLPTSAFVLIITALVSWWLSPGTMRNDLGRDIAAASVYISNYLFAFWQLDYQNMSVLPPVVVHYWSLAVEEQFYIFWPVLIFLLYKMGGRRRVLVGIFTFTLASLIFGIYLTFTSPVWAFYSLPTRAWELGIGALLLFLPKGLRLSQYWAWVALATFIYCAYAFNESTLFPGYAALLPVLATAICIISAKNWETKLDRFATSRISLWLGKISYPLYLWHWPLFLIPAVYFGRSLHIYEDVILIACTIALAHLTNKYLEEPLRIAQLKPGIVVKGAVAITVFSLILGLLISSTNTDKISLAGGKTYSLSEILQKPIVYADGCHVSNGKTKSPECVYGVKNSNFTVVLFGDSHATQWFPALEKLAIKNEFQLINLTKSACPAASVTRVDTAVYKNADCFTWRNDAIARINSIKPDVIIMSGFQHYELPRKYRSIAQWLREGEKMTLSKIRSASPHLVYLSDTPLPGRDIPSCLAGGYRDRCDSAQPGAAIFVKGFVDVDVTPWLCSKKCPAVINSIVTYRDASHITVQMSKKLASTLETALAKKGVALK